MKVDNRKYYRLEAITDHQGRSRAGERELYASILDSAARYLRLDRREGPEERYILRMELLDRYGRRHPGFHTSVVEELTEAEGVLTVTTHNSVYRLRELEAWPEPEPAPASREHRDLIELWLSAEGDRFCKGYFYDEKGVAFPLECSTHLGMTSDSCLICTEYGAIACRYFPREEGMVEFYDTLYGQQDYSRPLLIHNEALTDLQVRFQWSSADYILASGEAQLIQPPEQ